LMNVADSAAKIDAENGYRIKKRKSNA